MAATIRFYYATIMNFISYQFWLFSHFHPAIPDLELPVWVDASMNVEYPPYMHPQPITTRYSKNKMWSARGWLCALSAKSVERAHHRWHKLIPPVGYVEQNHFILQSWLAYKCLSLLQLYHLGICFCRPAHPSSHVFEGNAGRGCKTSILEVKNW